MTAQELADLINTQAEQLLSQEITLDEFCRLNSEAWALAHELGIWQEVDRLLQERTRQEW